jgi:hypothetical protein
MSFLYLKCRKTLNGGCVRIKVKITALVKKKNTILTENLNRVMFFFSAFYVYIYGMGHEKKT